MRRRTETAAPTSGLEPLWHAPPTTTGRETDRQPRYTPRSVGDNRHDCGRGRRVITVICRAHAHTTQSPRFAAARPARPASTPPPPPIRSGDRPHAYGGRAEGEGTAGADKYRKGKGGRWRRADAYPIGRRRPSPSQTIYGEGRRVAAVGRSVGVDPTAVAFSRRRRRVLLAPALCSAAHGHGTRQSIICARSADTVPATVVSVRVCARPSRRPCVPATR